jgi:hypothetical protein
MNTQTDRNLKSRLGAGLSPMLALAAIALAPTAPARAQFDPGPVLLREFHYWAFRPTIPHS